jgi:hypothetical protein
LRSARRAQAWLSILLAIFVIAELTLFIGVLNETAVTLLVAPLARILTVLRTQAARVMQSMERIEARPRACSPSASACPTCPTQALVACVSGRNSSEQLLSTRPACVPARTGMRQLSIFSGACCTVLQTPMHLHWLTSKARLCDSSQARQCRSSKARQCDSLKEGSVFRRAAPCAAQEETELGLMEAVVTKMSRIIAHVGSGTGQGAQILSSIQARTQSPPWSAVVSCRQR